MGHSNDRSTKAPSLVNPTSLNLQPRPFAPLESDEKEEAVARKSGYSENFLEKIINTPRSESATPVQRKSANRLKAIVAERIAIQAKPSTNVALQNQPVQRQESAEEEKSEGEQEDGKEFTMNPEPPPVQRKFENRLRAKNAQRMAIQTKLAIGEPNDKYEQEADATAARVVQQINSPITSQGQPVQRKFENRLRAKNAQKMAIQAKLAIGEPNDKYEQEADATAARVVQQINSSTNASTTSQSQPVQRQEIEEDELQMKPLIQRRESIGGGEASTDLESAIQSARGSGQSLDANLQQSMGQAMGADFSGVKVHTDSQSDQLNKSIQAKAFTTGQDLFFRQGAYEPSSRGGQELIAHELTHVVQQNGSAVQRFASTAIPTIQRYTEENIGGDDTRVADDESAAVTQEVAEGGKEMFADEGIVAVGQQQLKAVKSGIELQIGSRTMKFPQPDKSDKILKEIWPKNKQNKTGGIKKPSLKDKIKAKVSGKPAPEPQMKMMQLWADCGKSNGVVIGGSNRRAVFESQADDTVEKTSAGGPSKMKAQVLMKVLSEVADKWDSILKTMDKDDSDRTIYEDFIKEVRDEESWTKNEWVTVSNMIKTASTDDDWEKVRDKYDEIADHVLTLYTSFSKEDQDRWSKNAGINEYANPDIGQGFTISSGGENLSPNTWNFHWAGVILKSVDGADSVTLENYAVGDASVENDEWVFQMYGHKKKKQTFHQQHKGSGLHGKTPTTMVVENVPTKK